MARVKRVASGVYEQAKDAVGSGVETVRELMP
jgi:hypothetical protein